MNNFNMIRTQILELLRHAPGLRGVEFTDEYPSGNKPAPLTKNSVSVGIDSVEAEGGGYGGYIGLNNNDGEEMEVYGRRVTVVLRLIIASGRNAEGCECMDIFSEIAQALFFNDQGLDIPKLWCDGLRYDKNMQTVAMTAKVLYQAVLTSGTYESEIGDILVRSDLFDS